MSKNKQDKRRNQCRTILQRFTPKKRIKILLEFVLFCAFIVGMTSLIVASRTSTKAATETQISVTPSNFGQYFSWSANHSSTWSNVATTNGTTATGSYDYSSSVGTMTFTTATNSQVGIAALTSYKIDMTQSFTISGSLNLGKLGGADGVGFAFYPGDVGTTGVVGADLGIGGLRGAFGWTGDTYKNPASSSDPTYTLGDGTNASNNGSLVSSDYTHLTGGDPSQLVSGGAAAGWAFANALTKYDASSVPAPKTAYNNTTSPQQTVSALLSTSVNNWNSFTLTYTPGTGSTPANQGTLSATFGSYTWSIPITTLESLAGDVKTDTSGNPVYPNSLSFFMTGSTGGSVNLQQFRLNSMSFMPAKGNVITHYIDTSGNSIASSQTLSGDVGLAYTAAGALATVPTGYTYVGLATSANNSAGIVTQATSGTYTANDINVYYVYRPNVATVTYIDDTTGQTLATDSLTYPANATYTTGSRITSYESSGYQLVSDSTSGVSNLFVNASNSYVVHLSHTYTSTLKTVSETINYRDNSSTASPKALLTGISPNPKVTYLTFDTVKDNVTAASLTYYKAGQQTTAPTVTTSGTTTGQVLDPSWALVNKTSSGWQLADGSLIAFAAVNDPTASGYVIVSTDDANQSSASATYKTSVTAQTVGANMDNIDVNVYYDPTEVVETTVKITRKIHYVDANDTTIVLESPATQTAVFHSFQIIDKVTNAVLGYDTNGDGVADSSSLVWLADADNVSTNASITSPDESSKGYGLPSKASVAGMTDTPTTVTLTAPNNGTIIVAVADVEVSYPLSAGKITLPFTGGIGSLGTLLVFGFALASSIMIKRRKTKEE